VHNISKLTIFYIDAKAYGASRYIYVFVSNIKEESWNLEQYHTLDPSSGLPRSPYLPGVTGAKYCHCCDPD
jgi:hypothetical protein